MADHEKKSKGAIPLLIVGAAILAAMAAWAFFGGKMNEDSRTHVPATAVFDDHTGHDHSSHDGEHQDTVKKTVADIATDAKSTMQNEVSPQLNDLIASAKTWVAADQGRYGEAAPDFALKDLNGKEFSLSVFKGKDVMIILWATWCGYCRVEIPHLNEISAQADENNIKILAISDEDPELIKSFVSANNMNYTVLQDDGSLPRIFTRARRRGLPCAVFIDKEGKVKLIANGAMGMEDMKAVIAAK